MNAPFESDATIALFGQEPMTLNEFVEENDAKSEEYWEGIFEERNEYFRKLGASGYVEKLRSPVGF